MLQVVMCLVMEVFLFTALFCSLNFATVVLYEIVSFGEVPYTGRSHPDVVRLYAEGKRGDLPDQRKGKLPEEYKQLMEKCWSQGASSRPSFDQIIEYIEKTKLADKKLTI